MVGAPHQGLLVRGVLVELLLHVLVLGLLHLHLLLLGAVHFKSLHLLLLLLLRIRHRLCRRLWRGGVHGRGGRKQQQCRRSWPVRGGRKFAPNHLCGGALR